MKFYQQLSQVDVDGTIALSERHVHTASIEGTCSAAEINGPPRARPHFLNALKRVDLLDGSQRHVGKIRRSKLAATLLAPTNIIGFGLRRVQDFFQGEQVDSDVVLLEMLYCRYLQRNKIPNTTIVAGISTLVREKWQAQRNAIIAQSFRRRSRSTSNGLCRASWRRCTSTRNSKCTWALPRATSSPWPSLPLKVRYCTQATAENLPPCH